MNTLGRRDNFKRCETERTERTFGVVLGSSPFQLFTSLQSRLVRCTVMRRKSTARIPVQDIELFHALVISVTR